MAALRPVVEFLVLRGRERFEVWMIAGADPIVVELVARAMGLDAVPSRRRFALRGRRAERHLAGLLAAPQVRRPHAPSMADSVDDALREGLSRGTAGARLSEQVRRAGPGSLGSNTVP